MGYRISSLASLPVIPGKSVYVFVLGRRVWDGGLLAEVERNFANVAKEIGSNAAIIKGHEGVELASSLMDASVNGPPHLSELLQEAEEGEGSILILGGHPTEIKPDDLALFATLPEIEKRFGSMAAFFSALCKFTTDRNQGFLDVFEDKSDVVGETVSIFELKPNFCGIGLNLNAVIDRWRKAARYRDA